MIPDNFLLHLIEEFPGMAIIQLDKWYMPARFSERELHPLTSQMFAFYDTYDQAYTVLDNWLFANRPAA